MKKFKKGILYALIGFVVLFIIRLIYGYIQYPEGKEKNQYTTPNNHLLNSEQISSSEGFTGYARNNYASKKYKKSSMQASGSRMVLDQKYEKVCSMSTRTTDFEEDKKQIKKNIKDFKALIQYEQQSGLKGYRDLRLAIGVPPESFDSMIVELKKIGKVESIQINKIDKTNEYKELQAKQLSLTKTLNSLQELKRRQGKIGELIDLENRILDIQQSIQNLGVSLGDFDAENEFCTVKVTLQERKVILAHIPIVKRVIVAFEWTVQYYGIFIVILLFGSLAILAIIKIVEKLGLFKS